MEMYKKFVYYVKNLLEEDITLETDDELMRAETNWNIKMAIVYR